MQRAIIIIDHGSKRAEANDMLDGVAELLRQICRDHVYVAHMELAKPTLQQAYDRAVADGAEVVIIFPYFLSPGRHSREDIPRMCAEAAARHPSIRYHCCGPIGLDPMMADLIHHRVRQCEESQFDCGQCPDSQWCEGPGKRNT